MKGNLSDFSSVLVFNLAYQRSHMEDPSRRRPDQKGGDFQSTPKWYQFGCGVPKIVPFILKSKWASTNLPTWCHDFKSVIDTPRSSSSSSSSSSFICHFVVYILQKDKIELMEESPRNQ